MICDLSLPQGGISGAVPLPCEPVVQRAQEYAVKCLRNAVRADSREPVMLHAMRVAEIVGDLGWNADTIALALLHDVLADGDGSIPRIRRRTECTEHSIGSNVCWSKPSRFVRQPEL